MAKRLLEVECPCCKAALKVDPASGAVITHKAPEKPRTYDDITDGLAALKGEAAKREEIFQKSFADQKTRQSVLDKKFDELFKQAKDDPDKTPPKRDIDLD
ncbi:MAG TPA: hypothetical protein VEQ63_01345 [Bryobacteraceae bacterium]|nr:hypothetical protein [Bryobacteraceae bacterium]